MECSFDYIITIDHDFLDIITTANTNFRASFPTCDSLTITVTPVVPSTGQVLTSSSASINIFNSNTGK